MDKKEDRQRSTATSWNRPLALLAATAILVLLGSLFLGTGIGVSQAQGDTLVRCNPAVAVGVVGQPLDVDIYVENVVDLWAGDVQLSFDPNIAQIVDAEPASSSIQIKPLSDFLSPDFVVKKVGDNNIGSIWYAATQVQNPPGQPPKLPVSGSGPLARITFEAVKAGSFTMPITYQKIVKNNGVRIPATPQNCTVTFIEVSAERSTYMPMIVKP